MTDQSKPAFYSHYTACEKIQSLTDNAERNHNGKLSRNTLRCFMGMIEGREARLIDFRMAERPEALEAVTRMATRVWHYERTHKRTAANNVEWLRIYNQHLNAVIDELTR